MIPDWLKHPSMQPCVCGRVGLARTSYADKTLTAITFLFHQLFLAEESARRPGFLQRVSPRLKIVCLAAALLAVTITQRPDVLLSFFAVSLLLAWVSRLTLRSFLARTWLFIPLFSGLMMLPALLNVTSPGDSIWTLVRFSHSHSLGVWRIPQEISVTRQGIRLVSVLILRVGTAVSWTLLLVMTTRWNRLLQSLQVLRVPPAFVLAMTMMVRYLFVLVREAEEIHQAIQSRTIHHPPARQGQRVATVSLGALFKKSMGWVQEIYFAMVSRGYTGGSV